MKFLLIDNYDSFTFNLLHLFAANEGVQVVVRRNDDARLLTDVASGGFSGVVISPGPGSADDENYFGHNAAIIKDYETHQLPILGICLGFQGIYHSFGGQLKIADVPMHGKVSHVNISEPSSPLFHKIPTTLEVMRYHSIIADVERGVPACLTPSAFVESSDEGGGELMAVQHKQHPIYGLQFHPESFATEWGGELICNFIAICR